MNTSNTKPNTSDKEEEGNYHHLILHFDINETIWIGDEAGDDTIEQCLHKILAKSAFVRYSLDDDASADAKPQQQLPLTQSQRKKASKVIPTHWWDGSPMDESSEKEAPPPALWTEWEWPPHALPYYRTSYKRLADTFVNHHGCIYRPIYEKMQNVLQQQANKRTVPFQMLPAFLVTLHELSRWALEQHASSSSLRITVVLRTFGTDLPRVLEALTRYAQHQGREDWICPPQHVVQGRWRRVHGSRNNNNNNYEYQLLRTLSGAENGEGAMVVAAGDAAVLAWLHTRPPSGGGRLAWAAIQDDYDHWSRAWCAPQAGKPIWKTRDTRYHHILFDDNIHNLEHNSIACVREQVAASFFRTLSGRETLREQGIHLIRVPTVDAVLQERWFIEQIHAARAKHAVLYPTTTQS